MIPALALATLAFAPVLQAPWTCDETHSVGQGNNGGFSHFGTEQYAWDFGMPEGTPLVAAAGGTVLMVREDSTQGGCDSAFGNSGNYVVVDHGDGTAALYLHLQPWSVPVSVGDAIGTGTFLGRSGVTGWSCGAHLHFQVESLCGSWYCQSQPATFDGAGVPGTGASVTSSNCPPCQATLDGGVTEIPEHDLACFEGITPSWVTSTAGLGAHHFTTETSDGAATEIGAWHFDVAVAGTYEVWVHVPDADATTTAASYRIVHGTGSGSDDVVVDQGASVGWVSLGAFDFVNTGDNRIALGNATGEAAALGRRVAFDSVRLEAVAGGGGDGSGGTGSGSADDGAPTSGPSGDEGGGTDGGSDPTAGEGTDAWTSDAADDLGREGDDTGGDGTGGGGEALPPTFGGDAGGCACRAAPDRDRAWLGIAAWLLLVVRRRRRRE